MFLASSSLATSGPSAGPKRSEILILSTSMLALGSADVTALAATHTGLSAGRQTKPGLLLSHQISPQGAATAIPPTPARTIFM
jgi:hypothetical protein